MGKPRISASRDEVELFRAAFAAQEIVTKPLDIPRTCKTLDELPFLTVLPEPIPIQEASETYPYKKDDG